MANTIQPAPAKNAGQEKPEPPQLGNSTDRASGGLNDPNKQAQESVSKPNGSVHLPSFGNNGEMNLAQFRLGQNFVDLAPVAKLITVIPIRKPSKEAFVRAYPHEDQWFPAALIELKETNETYLVGRELWTELQTEPTFVTKLLVPAITRQGALILWPIRLPGSDGRLDDWNASALEIARIAKTAWVRLAANRSLGAYDAFQASSNYSEPVWPKLSVEQMVSIGFKDRAILSLDHSVIKGLRGEQ
jgi:hypothetical protein